MVLQRLLPLLLNCLIRMATLFQPTRDLLAFKTGMETYLNLENAILYQLTVKMDTHHTKQVNWETSCEDITQSPTVSEDHFTKSFLKLLLHIVTESLDKALIKSINQKIVVLLAQ